MSRFDLFCYSRLAGPADSAAGPAARGPESPLPLANPDGPGVPTEEESGASRRQRYDSVMNNGDNMMKSLQMVIL